MAIDGITSLNEPRSFAEAEKYVENLLSKNRYSERKSYSRDSTIISTFNLTAYSNHLKNIIREMGTGTKGVEFILSRAALHVLNPYLGMGKIYNPAAILGPLPGFGGYSTNVLDPYTADTPGASKIYPKEDRLKKLYDGDYTKVKITPGIPPVEIQRGLRTSDGLTLAQKMKELNIVAPGEKFNETIPFERQGFIPSENQMFDKMSGVNIVKPDISKMFTKQKTGPGFLDAGAGYEFNKPLPRPKVSAEYLRKAQAVESDDTFFSLLDSEQGYIDETVEIISDDASYIPFYFTDFRAPEKRIYFRAFIERMSEKFIPSWNKENFYGRTDPVSIYSNTERIISVDFIIAAMSSVGLSTMYKKINNFLKLLYPTYNGRGVLFAGPLGRMRIGDVFADSFGRGLPGYISDLSIDYSEFPWEVDSYRREGAHESGKVPMACRISVSWQVIHEQNPAVDQKHRLNQRFIRRMGRLPQGEILQVDEPDPQDITGEEFEE